MVMVVRGRRPRSLVQLQDPTGTEVPSDEYSENEHEDSLPSPPGSRWGPLWNPIHFPGVLRGDRYDNFGIHAVGWLRCSHSRRCMASLWRRASPED